MSSGLLQMENVTVRFGGLKAVSELSFHIGAEELVGLIGPNGAGKTTVFNLITGVYQPTEGDISFDGRSVVGHRPYRITARGKPLKAAWNWNGNSPPPAQASGRTEQIQGFRRSPRPRAVDSTRSFVRPTSAGRLLSAASAPDHPTRNTR